MIKDYLKLRGYGKTLEKLQQNETGGKTKTKKTRESKVSKKKEGEESEMLARLREEIIFNDNWEYFENEKELRDSMTIQLKINVQFRIMLKKYINAEIEETRISLLNDFTNLSVELREEDVIGAGEKVEEVLTNMLTDEKDYSFLLNLENKNKLLEIFYEQKNPKKCHIINILKYFDALLSTNSQLNGFEKGHSFDNFKF